MPFPRRRVPVRPVRPAVVPVLVPAVPEVAALIDTAGRVLAACAEVECARARRACTAARAVDPALCAPTAVPGGDLPRPLADRVALRALRRVALAIAPAATEHSRWDGRPAFRGALLAPDDLAVLRAAVARLDAPPGGALREVRRRLAPDTDPAALACLLGAIVVVDDAASLVVHALARERARTGAAEVGLDPAGRRAYDAVRDQLLAALSGGGRAIAASPTGRVR